SVIPLVFGKLELVSNPEKYKNCNTFINGQVQYCGIIELSFQKLYGLIPGPKVHHQLYPVNNREYYKAHWSSSVPKILKSVNLEMTFTRKIRNNTVNMNDITLRYNTFNDDNIISKSFGIYNIFQKQNRCDVYKCNVTESYQTIPVSDGSYWYHYQMSLIIKTRKIWIPHDKCEYYQD
ncbi:hypothetical protein A3Q56_07811, partial [Intoshia linei]